MDHSGYRSVSVAKVVSHPSKLIPRERVAPALPSPTHIVLPAAPVRTLAPTPKALTVNPVACFRGSEPLQPTRDRPVTLQEVESLTNDGMEALSELVRRVVRLYWGGDGALPRCVHTPRHGDGLL